MTLIRLSCRRLPGSRTKYRCRMASRDIGEKWADSWADFEDRPNESKQSYGALNTLKLSQRFVNARPAALLYSPAPVLLERKLLLVEYRSVPSA